ncbi:MAG: sensor histidine kinase [Chthoniobacteraceae bacterium]
MRFFTPIGPLLKGWLLSFAAFGLLAFALAGQFVQATGQPLTEGLRMGVRDWLPWAVLAPLIFRLAVRLPILRGGSRWTILVHLVCCVAALAACEWWATMVPPKPRGFGARVEMRTGERPPPPQGESPRGPRRGPPGGKRGPAFGMLFLVGLRLPIYLMILSIGHAAHFYRRSQERERRELELSASLAKARADALKMQLQPHFLFNALNSIAELVHRDPQAADAMIGALSDLLRLTLETSGEQELPLRREMDAVERYVAIEQVRFGDRIRVQTEIPAETAAALVPNFLLQPLVENAIRHGLQPQSSAGELKISAQREGEQLRIEVSDNGSGLREGNPARQGIGLANTRARLKELYGDRASLELRSEGGVQVIVRLPFRMKA